ncbi:MAG: DNA ligase D [Pseudomonadota bacterium]|nr:DNA ligase D [Pseudomonadota bacterium]
MSLDRYHAKRDFSITPEPRGKVAARGKSLAFFIQRHDASHLHFDFRLELDGTLKSWAVPKGPSLDPADKRLAVHVEDHPLDYGSFEGTIPAHQYGAGEVLLWDRGTWVPDIDPTEGYRKGHLKFHLEGEKLVGGWALVRMGPPKESKENWLLIKERDEAAREGEAAQVTTLRPESVAGIAKPKSAKKSVATVRKATKAKEAHESAQTGAKTRAVAAKPSKARAAIVKRSSTDSSDLDASVDPAGALPAEMPRMLKPQLATLSDHAPVGDDWLTELKFDGYRALCRIDQGAVTLLTRNGNDWTANWPEIATAASAIDVDQAWLDGEVVAIGTDGKPSFQALQQRAQHNGSHQLAYYVFDLVYLNGFDLSGMALIDRKRLLAELLSALPTPTPILFSDHVTGGAQDVFNHACMHGLEGVVAKRASGHYVQDRSRDWLKIKCAHRQEFVIGGYTEPAGARTHFGALLLGVYADGQLQYAGRVGTGFDQRRLAAMIKQMQRLETSTSPFVTPPTGVAARGVHWLAPELVAEVQFAEWTDTGAVRHASFVGLREDKPAKQVKRELPVQIAAAAAKAAQNLTAAPGKKRLSKGATPATGPILAAVGETADPDAVVALRPAPADVGGARSDDNQVAGVTLTHPSRILFAESSLTKRDLARYYESVAQWLLPHLHDRPLSLVRCPQGGGKQCFFQKHVTESTAEEIERVKVPGDAHATYMMANSIEAVISMVQMGVLELHTWGASAGRLEQPDRIIFDLDPAPEVVWQDVVDAALLIRGMLGELGLVSFVKTTGGKGLHVVAPIRPEYDWDTVKAFTRAIAEHLASTMPDRFTAKMSKATRTGRIFIDYLRNGVGATAVAAFSTRARAHAPVSVPIAWEELDGEVRSDTFTVVNLPARLAQLPRDPWQDYFNVDQRITAKMLKLGR